MLGERLSDLIDFEGVKLAAGALMLAPYIPLLFMGQEYGEKSPFLYFVSHSDPELVAAVREGRKKEFTDFHLEGDYIDPQSVEAFNLSKINWEQRKEDKHQVLWQLYQKLIVLRRTIPALKKLDKQNLTATAIESDRVILLHRWQEQSQIFSILNFNKEDVNLNITFPSGNWKKNLRFCRT
jgi:maltooligosyltrehalose trehalohydrolase